MAATGTPTQNIGLRRPQGTDPASVDDINYNSARIDTVLGAVGSTSVKSQIDTLNSNIANFVQSKSFNLASNKKYRITFPNNSRSMVACVEAVNTKLLLCMFSTSSSGSPVYAEVSKGAALTVTQDTNTLTVEKSASSATVVMVFGTDITISGVSAEVLVE